MIFQFFLSNFDGVTLSCLIVLVRYDGVTVWAGLASLVTGACLASIVMSASLVIDESRAFGASCCEGASRRHPEG